MKPLTGKQLGRILEEDGWELARVHGSHPVHGSKPLKRGLQASLIKLAGIVLDG